jgi:hypothetical protein
MGGNGSGRRYGATPKETVESCLVLSSAKLQRDKLIRESFSAVGSLRWTSTFTGDEISSVGYAVNTLDPEGPRIRLTYTSSRTGEEMDDGIVLTTTPLPWGGVRWWVRGPFPRGGRLCRRRCGKLYLPPSARYFACRVCYNLTYESSQEAHRFDGAMRELAREVGTSLEAVRRLLAR